MYSFLLVMVFLFISLPVISADVRVKLTPTTDSFKVQHNGKDVEIKRVQDPEAGIDPAFNLVARDCPPFCPTKIQVDESVKTIGEYELFQFMRDEVANGFGIVVDARRTDQYAGGTIPGSINIPYTVLNRSQGAGDLEIEEAMERLGVIIEDDKLNFDDALSVVLWCNGPWCNQSPTAIQGLLNEGYPADQIFYYRGGMQLWQMFGLTVVKP